MPDIDINKVMSSIDKKYGKPQKREYPLPITNALGQPDTLYYTNPEQYRKALMEKRGKGKKDKKREYQLTITNQRGKKETLYYTNPEQYRQAVDDLSYNAKLEKLWKQDDRLKSQLEAKQREFKKTKTGKYVPIDTQVTKEIEGIEYQATAPSYTEKYKEKTRERLAQKRTENLAKIEKLEHEKLITDAARQTGQDSQQAIRNYQVAGEIFRDFYANPPKGGIPYVNKFDMLDSMIKQKTNDQLDLEDFARILYKYDEDKANAFLQKLRLSK